MDPPHNAPPCVRQQRAVSMSLEFAFLQAVQSNPQSRLAVRVRRAARRARTTVEDPVGARSRQAEALRYRIVRLGKRWRAYRVGGCSWLGPIASLQEEWATLRSEARTRGIPAEDVTYWLAEGIGASAKLDPQARDYLLGLVASRGSDAATLCRIGSVRWLSPATLVVEATHDVAGHGPRQQQDLHAFLTRDASCADEAQNGGDDVRWLCRATGEWLEASAADVRSAQASCP